MNSGAKKALLQRFDASATEISGQLCYLSKL